MTEEEIRADERKKCWNEINALIKRGPLSGSGFDESAERNGLVFAANILAIKLWPNPCNKQFADYCADALAIRNIEESAGL